MTQASAGVCLLAMAIAIGTTVSAWAHGTAERMRLRPSRTVSKSSSCLTLILQGFRRGGLAAIVGVPIGLAAIEAAAFEPVDYRGPGATIQLSRLSTYDGGYFASSTAEVPQPTMRTIAGCTTSTKAATPLTCST